MQLFWKLLRPGQSPEPDRLETRFNYRKVVMETLGELQRFTADRTTVSHQICPLRKISKKRDLNAIY